MGTGPDSTTDEHGQPSPCPAWRADVRGHLSAGHHRNVLDLPVDRTHDRDLHHWEHVEASLGLLIVDHDHTDELRVPLPAAEPA